MSQKIVFLTGCINQIGGIERITLDLAAGFVEKGFDVSLVSYSKAKTATDSFILPSGIKFFFLSQEPKSIRYAFFFAGRLRKILHKLSPDVLIYADTLLFPFFHFFVPKEIKQIAWEHFNYTVTFGKKTRTIARKLAVKKADACVVLTEMDRELFLGCCCSAKAYIEVIPNLVRFDLFWETQKPQRPVRERKRQVLCVTRFAYQKAVPDLIAIWETVEKQTEDWTLVIVGDGEERSLIEKEIQERSLRRVVLAGLQTNIAPFYRESQILVLGSRFEGLPLVLIEGLFFGLPEIAFDCPFGPADIIENGKTGYLLAPGDASGFSQKLLQLIQDESLRQQFSRESLRKANEFLFDSTYLKWERLFRRLGVFR